MSKGTLVIYESFRRRKPVSEGKFNCFFDSLVDLRESTENFELCNVDIRGVLRKDFSFTEGDVAKYGAYLLDPLGD